jgi:DNA invertase Pin-like site-specific DNA recombinase
MAMQEEGASAAIYLRASTEKQVYSIGHQADALGRYAQDHGYRIIRTYEDDGRSGLTLDGRPGLCQLLLAAISPDCPFKTLLVYDVSRWGRFQDTDESAHYEYLCRRAGIHLIYVAEPFDNDGSTTSNVLKALKRAMAAEFSRELSEKVHRAKRCQAARGHTQGVAGYGLRRLLVSYDGIPKVLLEAGQHKALQSDHVVFVPGPSKEIAVVRRIFRLYANYGMGFADIAKYLNRSGIKTQGGGPWSDVPIKRILENEAYIGNYVYGRTKCKLKGKLYAAPPEEWVRCDGALPAIVPKKTFMQARHRMGNADTNRSDEYYLIPLRALFKRNGYLTGSMIDAEPDMLSANAYGWRFQGVTNAYARVGYISPYCQTAGGTNDVRARHGPVHELMLQKLKELLDWEGYLTAALVNAAADLPSLVQYQWAFQSLRAAYRLIGYRQSKRTIRRSLRAPADRLGPPIEP